MIAVENYTQVEIPYLIQHELLENCDARHRLIVGGRGKGASWSIARILLHEGMTDSLFIPCVREVMKTIKYSVKKLLDDTIKYYGWQWFYKSTDNEIRGLNDTLFTFFGLHDHSAENIKSLEGADRCWVAESQSLARRSINVLRPTIRKDGAIVWWDLNPRFETDPVYVDYIINDDPHAKVLFINWQENPWFGKSLQMEKESDYARDEIEARHIWEGELRNAGDRFVCPSTLVDPAMNFAIDRMEGAIYVGADIAHQGGDEIVFYKRIGERTIDQYYARYQNSIKTTDDLKLFMGDRSVILNIDNGSLGMAVADNMLDDGYITNRVNFGGRPSDVDHYEDIATEMYFNLRDKLPYIDIPYDKELRSQLIQRKYDYINGRRGYEVMKIESKKELAEHVHGTNKSPDRADALALAFYEPEVGSGGFGETVDYNIF